MQQTSEKTTHIKLCMKQELRSRLLKNYTYKIIYEVMYKLYI